MEYSPIGMNIELTTCCPLHCPQCYCTLEGGKHIPLDVAKRRIIEAGRAGVKTVNLSGGETLCYPDLYEIIRCVKENCGTANVALSGWSFTEAVFDKLVDAGVGGIFISLNGSTEEINHLTRDGYQYALHALQLLHDKGFQNTYVNWVMHSSNADDFENVVRIAEQYGVKFLVILAVKPDSKHELKSFPSLKQMQDVANTVRTHRGKTTILVENCYSQMRALVFDTKLLGNLNKGKFKGCGAGRWTFNVSVSGALSPCRHLEIFENYESIEDYWANSETLKTIREVEDHKRQPCDKCSLSDSCRHCLAVNYKLHNALYLGHDCCELWKFDG